MDTTTLCLIAIIVIAVIFLIPRLMGNRRTVDYSQRGNESPRVDSPEISSRGGFGGDADSQSARGDARPTYDDRDVESRGGFGRDRDNEPRGGGASSFSGTTPPKRDFDDKDDDKKGGGSGLSGFRPSGGGSTKRDDPDVESRGGFGRNKD
jgi:hypothetical protein